MGACSHRQEQEGRHQQEGSQFQGSHPEREICSYFCKAVRALWNGGKNGPVQEHQKDATVPGAPAYRAFFIWRKAQPCSR